MEERGNGDSMKKEDQAVIIENLTKENEMLRKQIERLEHRVRQFERNREERWQMESGWFERQYCGDFSNANAVNSENDLDYWASQINYKF